MVRLARRSAPGSSLPPDDDRENASEGRLSHGDGREPDERADASHSIVAIAEPGSWSQPGPDEVVC